MLSVTINRITSFSSTWLTGPAVKAWKAMHVCVVSWGFSAQWWAGWSGQKCSVAENISKAEWLLTDCNHSAVIWQEMRPPRYCISSRNRSGVIFSWRKCNVCIEQAGYAGEGKEVKVWLIDVTNRAAYFGAEKILKVTCQNHSPSNAAAALGYERVPDVPPHHMHEHGQAGGGRQLHWHTMGFAGTRWQFSRTIKRLQTFINSFAAAALCRRSLVSFGMLLPPARSLLQL